MKGYRLGAAASMVALAGLWGSAGLAERDVAIRTDALLAQHAIRYLAVVTPPGVDQAYDARRLLSAANALADASFWPGGLQIALGQVPLVPDTIGLAPLPEALLDSLETGRPFVLATHARVRAAVVPFPDRERASLLGWAAAWRTVRPNVPSSHAALLTLVAVGAILAATAGFRVEHTARWRLLAFVGAAGMATMLALDLGWSVYRTARVATDTRLLTVRRLMEIAATAEGVRQARLPEIGWGTTVRMLRRPMAPSDDVLRDEEDGEPVARVSASTPRSQGGLVMSARPMEADLGGLWLRLLGWLELSVFSLAATGWAAGHRPRRPDPARLPTP